MVGTEHQFTTVSPLRTSCSSIRRAFYFPTLGITRDLQRDNAIREGEVFNVLMDFKYVLQTILTSLREIGPGEEHDDIVIQAFQELTDNYLIRYGSAFTVKKEYKARGCHRICKEGCSVCDILLQGNKVQSRVTSKKIPIKQRFTCESKWAVLVINCATCKAQFVGTSAQSIAAYVESTKHAKCKVTIFVDCVY